MSKQRSEEEILKEAHAYRAELDRREERKEVYLRVAAKYDIKVVFNQQAQRFRGSEEQMRSIELEAEAIYQGLIEFCGEPK